MLLILEIVFNGYLNRGGRQMAEILATEATSVVGVFIFCQLEVAGFARKIHASH